MNSQPMKYFGGLVPSSVALRTGCCVVAGVLGMAIVSAAPAQSLEQLAQRVADEHPQIRQARAAAEAAQHDVEQVLGRNGLRIGAYVEPGRTFGGTATSALSGSDMGVRATYPIYDWGKAEAEADQARARLEAAKVKVTAAVVGEWTKLSDMYVEVVRSEGLLAVTRQYVEALQSLHDQVQEIVQVDQGRRVDLQQVDSRLQQAQLQELQRETVATEALVQIKVLTDLPAVRVLPVDDISLQVQALAQERSARLDRHPAVLEAEFEVKAAQQAVHVARAQEKPEFGVQLSVGSRTPSGSFNAFQTADVRIVSQWDLYDGGAMKASSNAAGKRMAATKEQMRVVRRDLGAEVDRTWLRQQQVRARLAAWKQQIAGTLQLRDAYWEQFRAGRRTILDLLSIENDIYQARLSETTERHDLLQSEYRLFIQLGHASERWLPADTVSAPVRSAASPVPAEGPAVRRGVQELEDDMRDLNKLAAVQYALRLPRSNDRIEVSEGMQLKLSVELRLAPEAALAQARPRKRAVASRVHSLPDGIQEAVPQGREDGMPLMASRENARR